MLYAVDFISLLPVFCGICYTGSVLSIFMPTKVYIATLSFKGLGLGRCVNVINIKPMHLV